MAKWRYPGYLPKPPHEMTDFDWQTYKTGLSKEQMSERYSGITSDLIPAFEQIQAQGLGDINPDPYKRVSPFGAASESKSISEIFYPDGAPHQLDSNRPRSLEKAPQGGVKSSHLSANSNQHYGLRSSLDTVKENVLGTEKDPSAVRLGWEWLTGTGPHERDLGEGSRFVESFKMSEGVRDAREELYNKYDGWLKDGDSWVNHKFKMTIPRALRAHTAAEQFIGSYNMDLHVKGGQIYFKAINRSSVDSLLYGTARKEKGMKEGPAWEGGPMGNKYQTITWSEPVVQRWPCRSNTT